MPDFDDIVDDVTTKAKDRANGMRAELTEKKHGIPKWQIAAAVVGVIIVIGAVLKLAGG